MAYRSYSQYSQALRPGNEYSVMGVQNREHRATLIKESGILCIKIHAEWCKPCKQIAPEYASLAQEFRRKGLAVCVEEDLANGIRNEFEISSVPTFLIFHRGHLVDRVEGADLNSVRNKMLELVETASQVHEPNVAVPLGHAYRGDQPLYRSNYGQNPHPEAYPSFETHGQASNSPEARPGPQEIPVGPIPVGSHLPTPQSASSSRPGASQPAAPRPAPDLGITPMFVHPRRE